jgi:dephospho-CoA kinase
MSRARGGAGDAAGRSAGRTPPARVLRVGLTGGIACGKTTVARHFASWGAEVIDADLLARRLVEPGAAGYAPVVRVFGTGILAADGSIDRAALGRIVFSDARRRIELEGILHPLIAAEERAAIDRLASAGRGGIAVVNAALLVEAGTYRTYDRLVLVHCAEEIQVARIVARDGLSRDDALARVRAQLPTADKLKVAHYAIDTGAGFASTEAQARAVWSSLQRDRGALRPPS